MKRLKYFLVGLLSLAVLFSVFIFPTSKVEAAEAIIYWFEGMEIPEGESTTFTVDQVTMNYFALDNTAIDTFLAALAAKYNYNGRKLDETTEKSYILAVIAGVLPGGLHIPAFIENTIATNDVDINARAYLYGNGTYIDIDKASQKLVYYENGAAKYIADIVTGNVSAGNDTPEGVYKIVYKQRDRLLKGEDYESFVHYWMRFVGNIGIHDASWRTNFGDSIYMTNGSHGCVNVPPAIMPYLYEDCPEGTVVVVRS